MKKRSAFVTAALILAVIAGGCLIRPMPGYEKNPPLPQAEGTIKVSGTVGEIRIVRDKWGVPHIFADNEKDLHFGSGFVQAQDRLWEMVLFRAVSQGKLCEIFGNVGIPGMDVYGMKFSTLEMDKRHRIMGMRFIGEVGEAMLADRQPELLAIIQAYCDGINSWIDKMGDDLPIEFRILHFEPEPFRPADVIALSRFYGSMLCANLEDELLKYALVQKYGEEMAWELMPLYDDPGPTIVPTEILKNRLDQPRELPPGGAPGPSEASLDPDAAMRLALMDKAIRTLSGFPKNYASNNWVVGPSITETGTAMLANDPHLVHIEPSLCYVMHMKGAGYDAYGVAFPGQPFIVMGHTRWLSWGATVTGADVQDLFIETTDDDHPGQYLYKGEWRDFIEREEVIRVRPGKIQATKDRRYRKKTITVRHSVHGPIINDIAGRLPKDTPPLALRWTGWDFSRDPRIFERFITCRDIPEFIEVLREMGDDVEIINVAMMFRKLMQARGVDDFVEAMHYNELLSMNWVAADSSGHIAYLPGGLVPVRGKGIGAMPAPGESGEYDWKGFIPLMEHPYAIDPERGYMATANNEVVDAEWYPYVFATDYAAGWRAYRIEELINELKPIDVDDMRRIQNDVYVKQADYFVPLILKAVEKSGVTDRRVLEAAGILKRWNREATIDQAGPAIYYDTMSHLTDNVLKDEFKKEDYNELVKGAAGHAVQQWVLAGESEFFDNKDTKNKVEDVNDVLAASLADAVKWITGVLGKDMQKWKWGDLHTIKWYHPMGFGPLKEMSIGPYPHPGGNDTVRNAGSMGFGDRKYMCMGGPVMRHVIDMGDPDNALLAIDGSQSGIWLSPHYRDMHTLWYNSDYMRAEKRPAIIEKEAESILVLKP